MLLVKYGGTSISSNQTIPAGEANTNGLFMTVVGGNVGATNSQTWDTFTSLPFSTGGGNGNHNTSAIDSTANQNITVTFQGGANPDSITVYRVIVEVI